MKYSYLQAALGAAIYVALVLTPLAIMLLGPVPAGRGFWMEFGVALGFVGFTMLALQFTATGRYRDFAIGFGSDNLLQLHLATGVVAMLIILSHPVVILLADRQFLHYLDPRDEILRALALWGVTGAVLLMVTLPQVKPGTRVFLEGPHGTFTIRWDSPLGSVFVAGGIGITPVMSILRTLAARGDRRPYLLFYANSSWDEVVFRDEIVELEAQLNLRVIHVLEDPPEGWEGESGYVDGEMLDRHLPRPLDEQFYYICGPKPLMDVVEQELARRGVPLRMIQSERFEIV